MSPKSLALFDKALVGPAIVDSFRKLSPATQWRNDPAQPKSLLTVTAVGYRLMLG